MCGSTEAPAPAEASEAGPGQSVRWVIPGVVDDPRHGALAPEVVARLLSDPDVTLRLARLDPDGSIVQDPTTYRPSASVRRRVRSRDGGCRFPGCHVPARNTDLDHVIAFPHGPTDPANLVCLCRTHHGFKHHGGWTLSLAGDGTATWRAPDGRSWVTEPRPHGIRDDLRLTADLDADRLHDLRSGLAARAAGGNDAGRPPRRRTLPPGRPAREPAHPVGASRLDRARPGSRVAGASRLDRRPEIHERTRRPSRPSKAHLERLLALAADAPAPDSPAACA